MSGLGHSRRFRGVHARSALPPNSDIARCSCYVSKGHEQKSQKKNPGLQSLPGLGVEGNKTRDGKPRNQQPSTGTERGLIFFVVSALTAIGVNYFG